MKSTNHIRPGPLLNGVRDVTATLILWVYFILGFLLLFTPFYAFATLFSSKRESAFQWLNHHFFKGFFYLIRLLAPGHNWEIEARVKKIRSAVIVCNHRSYLDPLILISLYPRQKTIVKSRLFTLPVFGQLMTGSGYIPSTSAGRFADQMIREIESMGDFLHAGGNLFIFPEGTRSLNGNIGRLNRSAFKIARQCRAHIEVVFIQNTDRLFRPGRFRFETRGPNTITVSSIGRIDGHIRTETTTPAKMTSQVQQILEKHNRTVSAPVEGPPPSTGFTHVRGGS